MASDNEAASNTSTDSTAPPVIELSDNGVSLGPVTMTGPTTWSKQVTGLAEGASHSFKATVAGGVSSSPWDLTVRPVYENFDASPEVILGVGDNVETSTMKITFVSGPGQMGIQHLSRVPGASPPIPGWREGNLFHLNYGGNGGAQVVRMELKGSCTRVSFWQTWVDDRNNWVRFYNSRGESLGQQMLGVSGSGTLEVVLSGNDIARIDIGTSIGDIFALDWFRFSWSN